MKRVNTKRILSLVLFIFTLLAIRLVLRAQTSITVSSTASLVLSNSTQQFTVSEDSANNPTGTWSASCGIIDQNGMYTAPSVPVNTPCTISFTNSLTNKVSSNTITVIPTFDGPAQLPIGTVKSSLGDAPAPGPKTLVVPLGFQTAINNAKCGDTLLLPAGSTINGSYVLPQKACDDNHWIVIRTSAADSLLPPEGTRINPCYAGVISLPGRPVFSCPIPSSLGAMAKIVANKGAAVFTLAAGANHYRIGPGLEVTRQEKNGINFGLITATQNQPADHIVIDRDWIHGTAQDETMRGVFISGVTYVAIIDSYINDFHCIAVIGACTDAQAIAGGTGQVSQGMWKIQGNFLEGAAETILTGGVLKNSTTPTDITIVHNHLFKPLTWLAGQSGFVGGVNTDVTKCLMTPGQCPFIVKNLFELKNAQRVLLEGNVLENVWPGFTQHGNAILLSGLNPPGQLSSVSVADITIRYNRIAHTTAGLVIANMATNGVPNLPVAKISIHDNVFDDISPVYANGDNSVTAALPFQINNCLPCVPITNASIRNNTMLLTNPKIGFILGAYAPALMPGISFINNTVTVTPNVTVISPSGIVCLGPTNLARINNCFASDYQFTGNVLIGATSTWPAGNFLLSNVASVGFTNANGLNGGDYTLLPTSLYKGKGTDGKDPGADIAAVNNAIAGVN